MHIIKHFSQSVLASSVFLASTLVMAHEGHHRMAASADASMNGVQETVSSATQTLKPMTHSISQLEQPSTVMSPVLNHPHDHRKEHGAQVYSMTTLDNKWLFDEHGTGALKSKLETRIGTDENKIFIKAHINKSESADAEYDVKALYSRNISDFWDAQAGLRYRYEKTALAQGQNDTEEQLDAVFGLHGMAQYFFETDAYLYLGQDDYVALSLETERDVLVTQKLILKPYLEMDVVVNDDSKYAQKAGLGHASFGLETRYEINKKVMPYLDIAYEYSKGQDETTWQSASSSEQGWVYGAGLRIKF
ncbi:copper resistance protein B [Acinetobacter celticus]|uniref:Copper resistance protein CopB n=1 Tax=Acinetobacter celticus TaxID=1891224 RepID=A0A1C3CT53_9GAMM|nr:copper resistance protein B [Acinetobacter celticus]ODA11908.1 copper resistance protein CopB [Acinetobacter celticus]